MYTQSFRQDYIPENYLVVNVRQHSGQYSNDALLALILLVDLEVKEVSNFTL